MTETTVYGKLKIRCICGRKRWVKAGERETCACRRQLSFDLQADGRYRPWVHEDDPRDYERPKYNRPEIVGWREQ